MNQKVLNLYINRDRSRFRLLETAQVLDILISCKNGFVI